MKLFFKIIILMMINGIILGVFLSWIIIIIEFLLSIILYNYKIIILIL